MKTTDTNTNTTGTYYEGLADYYPTPEDLTAYREIKESVQPSNTSTFKLETRWEDNPAYKWVSQHGCLSAENKKSFVVYTNNYRDYSTGHYSVPMDDFYYSYLRASEEV